MRHVASIVIIAPATPVPETSVREKALDDGALSPVGVVEIPAPAPSDELQGSSSSADGKVALDLEGGDEGTDVVGEFRGDGAEVVPEGCEVGGYGVLQGGRRDGVEEGERVGVLRMERSERGVITVGSEGDVKKIGVDCCAESVGAGKVGDAEVCGVACPRGEIGTCCECSIETMMVLVRLAQR